MLNEHFYGTIPQNDLSGAEVSVQTRSVLGALVAPLRRLQENLIFVNLVLVVSISNYRRPEMSRPAKESLWELGCLYSSIKLHQ